MNIQCFLKKVTTYVINIAKVRQAQIIDSDRYISAMAKSQRLYLTIIWISLQLPPLAQVSGLVPK